MLCDRCKECGVADKFEPPSGHTKSGWCPVKQRFADGIANRRLRDLHVAPRELRADGCAFLERVRSGAYTEVRKELLKKPELILMCVPAAPAHLVAEDPQTPPQWTWSVLHEAIQKCNGSAPNDSSMETFRVLLEHCALLKINIDKTLPNSSKTWATPLHQACWRGSRPAIQGLLVRRRGRSFCKDMRRILADSQHVLPPSTSVHRYDHRALDDRPDDLTSW